MQKLFSVKDESRYTRRWGPDGADDLCDEDYAVINFRGEEVFRTPSRIEAERWIRAETARFFSASPSLASSAGHLPLGAIRRKEKTS
jgi:hypothetical protein